MGHLYQPVARRLLFLWDGDMKRHKSSGEKEEGKRTAERVADQFLARRRQRLRPARTSPQTRHPPARGAGKVFPSPLETFPVSAMELLCSLQTLDRLQFPLRTPQYADADGLRMDILACAQQARQRKAENNGSPLRLDGYKRALDIPKSSIQIHPPEPLSSVSKTPSLLSI